MTSGRGGFDPDQFQMTIGDHLEELRRRIFLGIAGMAAMALVCLYFGKSLVAIFCRPLFVSLQKSGINPRMYTTQLSDGFMVVIKMALISAAALASPWIVYQIWQFVRTGLYPNERAAITKYIPLSLALLISGMLMVYFMVLPWTLQFFIGYANAIPIPQEFSHASGVATTQPTYVQAVDGDPAKPAEFQIWFDTSQSRLKLFTGGRVRVIPFGGNNLVATQFTLPDYLDLVFQLLLTFGLAFQLPLVVMALAKIGIVDVPMLRSFRRYVYFGLCVLAAALAPGDVVTATIALMVPLIFLYEFGIFLAKLQVKKEDVGGEA